MRWLLPLTLVSLFLTTVYTEVFDLGDLKQYEPKTDKLQDGLQPDSIYISEVDDGFRVVLGKDVKAKVDGAVQACGGISDQCFQTIQNILKDSHVQTDPKLGNRQLLLTAGTVGEAFQTISKLAAALGFLIMALNALDGKQLYNEKGSHWPELSASNAAKLPEAAPVTISAAGSAIVTVTQAPGKTTLEGSITPVVTVVESASDGFEKGDLSGTLDAGLAGRIDEYMHRRKDCQAGVDFDKSHSKKRRDSGSYGQALCAAQAVMQGATVQGPFNDLVLLDPASVHFRFTEAAGAARDAADELAEFVKAYAPLIAVPEDVVQEISMYVLALAIDTIVENITLGQKNRIKATMVTTTDSPAATSTGCPKPASLFCGTGDKDDCGMKVVGDGGDKRAVCEQGKHKDCKCNPPPRIFINFATEERQRFLSQLNELLKNPQPKTKADCTDTKTPIPVSVFSSESMKVYDQLCNDWAKDKERSMTVDSGGKSVKPEPHLRKRMKVDAGTYRDWMFDLSFRPVKGDDKCTMNCREAFEHMSRACATFPVNILLPQLGPLGSFMYEKGSLDVGCGSFSYNIHKRELTELKEFERSCYKREDFESLKGDGVDEGLVSWLLIKPCAGVARPQQVIKKGDKNTFIHHSVIMRNVPYQYNIWWKDGCTLADDGPTQMQASNPLDIDDSGHEACQKTLWGNWRHCNNGGVGGTIQIGCLIYEFKADANERTW